MNGQQLPADPAAEASVLGACVFWGSRAIADVRSVVGDRSFYLREHQAVWDALRSLAEQGREIDKITLETELRSRGTLGLVGPQCTDRLLAIRARRAQDLLEHATLVAEHAQAREAIGLAQQLVQSLKTNPITGDALASALTVASEQLTDIARNGAGGKMPWSVGLVGEEWQREFDLELSGKTRAISTGFPALDRMCKRGGPRPGWLLFVSGRPKMGKTSFALQMAIEAMFDRLDGYPVRWKLKATPTPVMFVCDEMRARELYERLLANLAGLDASSIGTPSKAWYIDNRERVQAARRLLESAPLHFCPDEHSGDLLKAFGYVRRWRSTHPIIDRDQNGVPVREPALIVLDFLQSFADLPGTERRGTNEREGAKVKLAKNESKALGLVTIMLSQLNRDVEKRADEDDEKRTTMRPRASDNEGSGKIEQYGDVLMGCYRDAVYDPKIEEYREQIKNLRGRAMATAEQRRVSRGKVLHDLDEMVAIRHDPRAKTRFDQLLAEGWLHRNEFEELARATAKMSAAEIIVQLNRHGPTGTVYADFFGQFYRFNPKIKHQDAT